MGEWKKDKRQVVRLVRQFQQGQLAAFSELYQLYYSDICYYLRSYLKNDSAKVEDIAQETFLQIYKKIGQLKKPESFIAWMYQVAYRTLLNTLRDEQRHNLVATETFDEQASSSADSSQLPEDLAETHERHDLLVECVNQLDRSQRAVLLLRYAAQLNATEIAGILQRSPGTVRNQLTVSRRELKGLLQQRGVTLEGIIPISMLAPGKNSVLAQALRVDIAHLFPTPSAAQAKSFVLRSAPRASSKPFSAQTISGSKAHARPPLAQSRGLKVAVCIGVLTIVAGAGAFFLAQAPVAHTVVGESAPASLPMPAIASGSSGNTQSEQQAPKPNPPTGTPAPDASKKVEPDQPVPRVTAPHAPVPADPTPPVIMLAHQRITASVGVILSPKDILAAAGAYAIDRAQRPVPVDLVGYDPVIFTQAGTYALSVLARDGQGVKAKSRVIFVKVQ